MVALGAEVQHGAAEEAELHADLHEQREVAEAERLEAGDVAAEVVGAAVLARVAGDGLAAAGQLAGPGEHLGAVLLERQVVRGGVALLGEPLADAVADGGVRAVEEALQLGGCGGGRGGHGCLVPAPG